MQKNMNSGLRRTKLAMLLGLLALLGFTTYAYRAIEYWRRQTALTVKQTATLSNSRQGVYEAPNGIDHGMGQPQAQSGGVYQVTQTVIAGGSGISSNGNTSIAGTIGQSAAATSSGGQYAIDGG